MIASDGGEMEGQWTGGVTTTVKQSLLTIPILAIYKSVNGGELELGPWFLMLHQAVFGEAYDGYLRDGDLQAKRQCQFCDLISMMIQAFQCGMQLGAQWRAFSFKYNSEYYMGVVPIFKKISIP